jgi:hypothetical protein
MSETQASVGGEVVSAAGAAAGMGVAATAAAVSACCAGPALGPLVVSILGAGGAVALEGLRPYSVLLLAFSGLAVGASFWLNARRARSCTVRGAASIARVAARAVLCISAIVWLAAVAAFAWAALAAPAIASPAPFTTLNSSDGPFHAAFNRDRGDVRVVELVSPTCPICLDGVSKVQHALFADVPSEHLVGFVVWVPMLGGKASDVPDATTLQSDARVTHYWDGSNDLGAKYARILPVAGGPAWDVYMLYAPGIVWSGADPPKPSFWMHQLPITNAPYLDATVFADRARQMLARNWYHAR